MKTPSLLFSQLIVVDTLERERFPAGDRSWVQHLIAVRGVEIYDGHLASR